jgi:DNA-binding PadR family transcriptional regulator
MGNLYRFAEPVLLFLLKTKGQTYGYELQKGLREHTLSDSVIEGGALYRTLRRLEDAGYVTSSWDTSGGGPARRQYKLTGEGEKHLQEWAVVLQNLSASMSKFVKDVEAVLAADNDEKTL